MSVRWRTLVNIIKGILAELTDQTAYQRHLEAHGTVHSAEAWRRFQDEHGQARARRPKCC
jgi:hypothetical protein